MATTESDDGLPRSSTEKLPIVAEPEHEADPDDLTPTAFDRLPDEIISQYDCLS